jgi:hypothetical protein
VWVISQCCNHLFTDIIVLTNQGIYIGDFFFSFFFFFETEGRQTSANAQEAVDHLASYLSSREEILQLGIK